jgi:hypothetical protein
MLRGFVEESLKREKEKAGKGCLQFRSSKATGA